MEDDTKQQNDIGKTVTKAALKHPAVRWAIVGLIALSISIFILFTSAITVLGFFDDNSSGSGGNDTVAYESQCNYEETKVTVMDGNNKVVLATQSLEDYILGVLCPEIGACSGQVASKEEHYIKAKIVAARTYVLARGGYNSSSKSITIRASTRDQQWCDVDSGCKVTKTDDLIPGYSNQYFYNTYPGDYLPVDGSVTQTYSYTEEDLQLLRQYYKDTYGELYLSDSYNSTISRLTSGDATSYKASTQNYWNKQAQAGKNYVEILDSTGTSGVADSEDYVGKTIYKLGTYCKSNNNVGSSNASINYVKWMIDFAADDSHGYSMANRQMNPDVDCSSFVYYALLNNGYNKSQLGSYPFATSSMTDILISSGFEKIPFDSNSLQEGDILWYPAGFNNHTYGHTEVYVGDGKSVGAHSNYDGISGDSSGNEVSVVSVKEYKSIFRKK